MKGYELLKAISDREIKDGAKIEIKGRFSGDLKGSYFIYSEGHFRFPIYKPNGIKYSDSLEVHDLINFNFEVIEENKEIKELGEYFDSTEELNDRALAIENRIKINEIIREINKIKKQLEEQETEDIETAERELNKIFKERGEK